MSEQQAPQEKQSSKNEAFNDSPEAQQERLEKLRAAAAEANKEQSPDELDKIRDTLDQAKSAKETNVDNDADKAGDGGLTVLGTHRALKKEAYTKKMQQVRSELSKPERSFSKLIHQPVVDKTSDISGKTVMRASGVLGGGLAALVGSVVLLYISRHYGYTYNYLVFFMLFIGGFGLGLLAELVLKAFKRDSKEPS